jgi:CTP synthase
MVDKIKKAKKEIRVGIIGKYFGTGDCILSDSYISVIEAIKHASYSKDRKPIIDWINAEEFEKDDKKLKDLENILKFGINQGYEFVTIAELKP